MGSDDEERKEDCKYVDESTGIKCRYKLVWREDGDKGTTNVAKGNDYYFTTSGILVFVGVHGDIVMSPQMRYTIK